MPIIESVLKQQEERRYLQLKENLARENETFAICQQYLQSKGLDNANNYQCLTRCIRNDLPLFQKINAYMQGGANDPIFESDQDPQKRFNQYLYLEVVLPIFKRLCNDIAALRSSDYFLVYPYAVRLMNKLRYLYTEELEADADPRDFCIVLSTLDAALPKANHQPTAKDIEALRSLADIVQGRPSPFWQQVGIIMLELSVVLAAVAGVTLLVGTAGMAAAAYVALHIAGATALTGFGIFAGNRLSRSDLSYQLMETAEAVNRNLPNNMS